MKTVRAALSAPTNYRHIAFCTLVLVSAQAAALGTGCGSGATSSEASNSNGSPSGACNSGVIWTPQQDESSSMRPGEACITCHSANPEAPTFAAAGTVYAALDQANDCNGINGALDGVTVVLTDANQVEHRLPVNAAGNFMLEGAPIALPYRARVERGTLVSSMAQSQTIGDCNVCHTSTGANGAPGRILAP